MNDNYYSESFKKKYLENYYYQFSGENPEVGDTIKSFEYVVLCSLLGPIYDPKYISTLLLIYGTSIAMWEANFVREESIARYNIKNNCYTKPLKLSKIINNK